MRMKRSGQILCTFWRKYQQIGGGISERIIFRLKTRERLMWASLGKEHVLVGEGRKSTKHLIGVLDIQVEKLSEYFMNIVLRSNQV